MISPFISSLYIFMLAIVLAALEIQVEGGAGWAKNLPTWRPGSETWYARLHSKIMSGKELTGYHMAMFGFVAMVFHLPYFLGAEFTFESWTWTLSILFVFFALWDFLWFVLNPNFSMTRFALGGVEWHVKWFWGLPVDYYYTVFFSLVLALAGGFFGADFITIFWQWLAMIIEFMVLTLIAIWVAKAAKVF